MNRQELLNTEAFEAALWDQFAILQAITWEGDMGRMASWYTWDGAWRRRPELADLDEGER